MRSSVSSSILESRGAGKSYVFFPSAVSSRFFTDYVGGKCEYYCYRSRWLLSFAKTSVLLPCRRCFGICRGDGTVDFGMVNFLGTFAVCKRSFEAGVLSIVHVRYTQTFCISFRSFPGSLGFSMWQFRWQFGHLSGQKMSHLSLRHLGGHWGHF